MCAPPLDHPLIGLIPAAGSGTRLAGHIVGSKEARSIHHFDANRAGPRSAVGWTFTALRAAGARRAVLIVRDGKWDVVEAAHEEAPLVSSALSIETLVLGGATPSSAHTLQRALADAEMLAPQAPDVALCYPDILFSPSDVLRVLRDRLRRPESHFRGRPDLVLGCFPTPDPSRTDMVEMASDGRLVRLVIKQREAVASTGEVLRWTWQTAVWNARFSRWFVDQVAQLEQERRRAVELGHGELAGDTELHIGRLIERSVAHDFDVRCVVFANGRTLDVGTPEALALVGGLG